MNIKTLLLFLIISFYCHYALSQVAGEDISICKGETCQLNSSEFEFIQWSPTVYLSNPNISNPVVSGLENTTSFAFQASSSNIIVNGDFESGNNSFTTNYSSATTIGAWGLLSSSSNYAITNSGNAVHINFQGFDHTNPPIGQFMAVNGSLYSNTVVWCQEVDVEPNTNYNLSAWVSSLVTTNPAELRFRINNEFVGPSYYAPNQTNTWEQMYTSWYSEVQTTAEICIINLASGDNGNDFGIDDITFNSFYSDTVLVVVNDTNYTSHFIEMCEDSASSGKNIINFDNLVNEYNLESSDEINWYYDEELNTILNDSIIEINDITKIYASKIDNSCYKPTFEFKLHSKPKMIFSTIDEICLNEQYNLSELNMSFQTDDNISLLNFYDAFEMQIPLTNYSPELSTDIYIYCETEFGCSDSSKMQLKVNPLPIVDAGEDLIFCSNIGHLNAEGIYPNGNWINDGFNYITDINNPESEVIVYETGEYEFYWEETNEYGCKNYDTVNVKFTAQHDNVNAEFQLNEDRVIVGTDIQLYNTSSNNIFSNWNFGNGTSSNEQNPKITYDTIGFYEIKLIVSNEFGCKDSLSRFIHVNPQINIHIPNCFTPNDDGDNDLFDVYGDGLTEYRIQIFNRWGENIYQNNNVGWDGKFKSKLCQNGTYFYKIEVIDIQNKTHYLFGQFSLLR